ncbi:MaoC family dehydratase [Actinomadura sp. KC345]|uniref:MaoC family dehydratase N-terminal domain-containing protein n=1 Tax=Actinomadura sp. KC345 TaxID=2530371 RepID=UPI001052A40F|nr:MaoC family dehydratase N-terminal domain-containing protein [Actinomadura sp. KC345]TDC54258.1 MaoC family dehydratase [Actinomadura sp. KC345]
MPIDASVIGMEIPAVTMPVERGRLRLFAKATGQTDPVYHDVEAARAAGHPDLPVPPTFFCALQNERPDPFDWLTAIGVDLGDVLHGEQGFTYHSMAHAGDVLTARGRIEDVYSKKGGALQFIARTTVVGNDAGDRVAKLSDLVVVRGEGAGS